MQAQPLRGANSPRIFSKMDKDGAFTKLNSAPAGAGQLYFKHSRKMRKQNE